MKDKLPRYTMRIERDLLDKLQYIAKYEGRTVSVKYSASSPPVSKMV